MHDPDDVRPLANLAASLLRLRRAAGWTQLATAERADLNRRDYVKIEGAEVNVTIVTLVKLARVFKVDPSDLLRSHHR